MNTHVTWSGAIALVVFATAAAAFAEPPPPAKPAAPNTPEAVFAAWDTDKNGALSPVEFNAGWARVQQATAVRGLQAQFARHDLDHNGALDAREMAGLELVRKAGASAPPLSRFDADHSGGLQFQEYVALVSTLAQESAGAAR